MKTLKAITIGIIAGLSTLCPSIAHAASPQQIGFTPQSKTYTTFSVWVKGIPAGHEFVGLFIAKDRTTPGSTTTQYICTADLTGGCQSAWQVNAVDSPVQLPSGNWIFYGYEAATLDGPFESVGKLSFNVA